MVFLPPHFFRGKDFRWFDLILLHRGFIDLHGTGGIQNDHGIGAEAGDLVGGFDFGCEDAPQVAWFFSQKARSILGIDLDNDPKNPFATFGNVEKCLTALDVMKALVSRLPPSIINRDSKALVVRFRH